LGRILIGIALDAPPPDVRPNMLAKVSLLADDGEALLHVPRSALIRNGTRDRVVIATKFGGNMWQGDANGGGSSRKSMFNAVEHSLRQSLQARAL
jgi:hypothetical protein